MRTPADLPAGAAARLSELQLQRDAAHDAARSAQARLNNLNMPDADQRMRDKLQAEQSKHQHRFGQLSQLVSRCNQWLMELRPGVTLEPACPVVFKPKDNETPLAAVERLRTEIRAAKGRLDAVKRAPLPIDDQRSLIVQAVAERARAGRPAVSIVGDVCRISWPEGVGVTQLLAWIDPQRLIDALAGELSESEGAMTAQERDSAVSRLQDQLEQLERSEQAVLEYADANGIDILPRVDASPAAVLSVAVVAEEAQAVA